MKLWLLRPADYDGGSRLEPWDPWYDKAFGYVVRAETEEAARRIAGDEINGLEIEGAWLDPKWASCVELSSEGKAEVIMCDFWAA